MISSYSDILTSIHTQIIVQQLPTGDYLHYTTAPPPPQILNTSVMNNSDVYECVQTNNGDKWLYFNPFFVIDNASGIIFSVNIGDERDV